MGVGNCLGGLLGLGLEIGGGLDRGGGGALLDEEIGLRLG